MRVYPNSILLALAAATMLSGASMLEPRTGSADSARVLEVEWDRNAAPSELAVAVRSCDLSAAQSALDASSEPSVGRPIQKGLVLGMAAESCGAFSSSLEFLHALPEGGELEDWRLFAIARSAVELGQYPLAKSALDTIREKHPASPLVAEAAVAAAELAHERRDLEGIARLARESRAPQHDRGHVEALDILAWQAGVELESAQLRREVAVRLLVESPLTASKLKVIEEFRAEDGSLDWLDFLTQDQIVRRAESLLEAGLLDSAIDTLEQVPPERRELNWRLMKADVLTAAGRGEEALEILDGLSARSRLQQSDLEWRRAFAALDVSAARPGRQLTALQRELMRDRAHGHLNRVVQLGLEPERSKRALRVLFEDALEADRFEQALAILRQLTRLDPTDTSGARHLWQYGWKQHQKRNYSGAIGYWTELSALYPTSSYNRSGLYWSARAYEALGSVARSRELLEQVVAVPFTDFYRRQALRRLGRAGESDAVAVNPTEPWPEDPSLARAKLLASWGLDQAALIEIDALSERADARAVGALRASVLSTAGERRKSIMEIKGVFSVLGTPFQGMAPDRAQLLYYPLAFDQLVLQNAEQNDLDPNLVLAMIRQESAFDALALSRAGARGLMQVMPATGREIARRLGMKYSPERLSDPSFSIRLGTTYYKQVRSMFGNDDDLALAGYNAGPYRIKRLWRQEGANAEVDRFLEALVLEETKSYVKRVLLFSDSYRRLYSDLRSDAIRQAQPVAG